MSLGPYILRPSVCTLMSRIVALVLAHSMICLDSCHENSCDWGFHCDCCRNVSSPTHPKTESRCIKFAEVCDGTPDCSDGSDEVNCFCSDDQFQCSPCERGEADCSSPFYCLPLASVGDGKKDCVWKDEEM